MMDFAVCHTESDGKKDSLHNLEGMIGYGEFNPSDDSGLTAMFDDLQEGTLLSTLNDQVFHDLATNSEGSWVALEISEKVDQSNEAFNLDNFCETSSYSDNLSVSNGETQTAESVCLLKPIKVMNHMKPESEPPHLKLIESACSSSPVYRTSFKRVRSNSYESHSSSKEQKLSTTIDQQQPFNCIQHDHCYTMNMKKENESSSIAKRSACSSSSDSLEEGNNSDGGYETMSAATSPGTQSNSEHQSGGSHKEGPLPQQVALPLLGGHKDPAAEIDNRIRHFMCSHEVNLSEEEKQTLKAEGMPIPTTLPLTKTEEKALRNVRRKIRNKVAAQESRKRKKEHVFTLEKRVKEYSTENLSLRKRIVTLESENKVLLAQLQKLVAVNSSGITRLSTQAGACLMVIALCFALIVGGCTPANPWISQKQSDYATSSVRSRSLLSLEHRSSFQSFTCNWFHHLYMLKKGFSYFCTDDVCGDNECHDVHLHIPSSIKELTNVSGHRHNIII